MIKLGALGDIFLADGALRDLRNHHKQDRITLLTTPPYRQLMERCPWVDRVQADPRAPRWRLDRMWQLRRELRAGRLAKVYDLQDSGRTQFYFRYLFPSVPWSGKAVGCSDPYQDPEIPYVADRLTAQLEAAGVSPVHTKHPDLSWLADDGTPYLEEAGVQGQFVVLVSGSSARNQQKRWDKYAQLAKALQTRGYTPVTMPGPDELSSSDRLPGVTLLHQGKALTLPQVAGVMRRSTAIIGNDSGLTHLGAFLGKPGIALFGAHTSHARPSLEAAGFVVIERSRLQDIAVDDLLTVFDSLSPGRIPA